MEIPQYQWPWLRNREQLEVPIPYIRPIFQAYVREYPHKIWSYMEKYLHFRILKFPLIIAGTSHEQMDDFGLSSQEISIFQGGSATYPLIKIQKAIENGHL